MFYGYGIQTTNNDWQPTNRQQQHHQRCRRRRRRWHQSQWRQFEETENDFPLIGCMLIISCEYALSSATFWALLFGNLPNSFVNLSII